MVRPPPRFTLPYPPFPYTTPFRSAVAAGPRIGLDLRSNNGGASDWSRQIAEILWGRQRVEALDGSAGVDWRASAGNVKTLTDFAAQLRDAPGTSAEMKRWIDETVAGITAEIGRAHV